MKKYFLLNLLACFFFSQFIYAEAKFTTTTPASVYSPYDAKENSPKVAPDSYYYIKEGTAKERLIKVTPGSDYDPDAVDARTSYSSSTSDYNPWFVPFDILITRPLGLATTVAGTALFVVFSPFTALSSIAPPHDAFERAADVFIVVPATYTFLRPVGKFLCPGDCRPADIK